MHTDSMPPGALVVLTALNVEYTAVRRRMTALRVHRHPAGTLFETGLLGTAGCPVALGLVGKGNQSAAVLAERAITTFSPAALLFAGVAGGLRPSVRLGDVVVASHVYAYHGGTLTDDGLEARPRVWETSHQAAQIVQHLIRTERWLDGLGEGDAPVAHFGPIAAGEVVRDSRLAAEAKWFRQHYSDAKAIEMEAAGVAQAGHLNSSLPVVVVRGISDRADGTKLATDRDDWQPRAAAHAAAFAAALAPELISAAGEGQAGGSGGTTQQNIATGDARVGVQAGQIHGSVTGMRGLS